MLFRRRSRDELHEARVADLKEAYEARHREMMRLVDMLAEQVEYLRAQLGRPFIAAQHPGTNPAQQLPVSGFDLDVPKHVGEEEEDLRALAEGGFMDEIALAKALSDQLGGTPISID